MNKLNMKDYDVGPAGYLDRARSRLIEGSPESLFYAALELRCFVEARQDMYLSTQTDYVKSIPRAWRIGDQWKALESVMKGPSIQVLHFKFDGGFEFDAFYVPVSISLRNAAERLSNLIHAQPQYRGATDTWWEGTRQWVLDTYRQAWLCQRGKLLCPALVLDSRAIGSVSMSFEKANAEQMAAYAEMSANRFVTVKVDYLDQPPSDWLPDL